MISARPSFGASSRARERRGERRRAGLADEPSMPRLALADEHDGEVSQRCEIRAGANRPSAPGTTGCHTTIEQRDEAASSVSGWMPEKPFASTLARSAIIARTTDR